MSTKLSPKIPTKYACDFCHYYTCNLKDYHKHLATQKHLNREKSTSINNLSPMTFYTCKNCQKPYKERTGLWRHNKKCLPIYNLELNIDVDTDELDEDTLKSNTMLTNLVMEVVKQNQETLKQNNELQKQIVDLCKNGITNNNTLINNNTHNKTFNLNVFLNEECKDAMNLTDFINSIDLQLSDLESVGKLGFVNGISNILIKNLNAMDVTKRPVHCSDTKREVMYVKEDGKW